MSRQQSQVNRHLVLMIQQLAECCALLDQRVAALESGASADSGHIHGRDPTPGEAVAEEESHY
jgi:hypothetical protein